MGGTSVKDAREALSLFNAAIAERRVLNSIKIVELSLSDNDLSGLNVKSLIAKECELNRVILRTVRLVEADFTGCRFDNADFSNANLGMASFLNCSLQEACFDNALFSIAFCNYSDLTGAKLRLAIVEGTTFFNSTFDNANLLRIQAKHAMFTDSTFKCANLREGYFVKCSFDKCDLTGADCSGSNFSGADFTGAKLTDVKWDDVELEGAKFDVGDRKKVSGPFSSTATVIKRGLNLFALPPMTLSTAGIHSFMKRSTIDQAKQERFQIRRQHLELRFIPLDVHMDDTRLPIAPADTVIEHDSIVPGRRRLSDVEADIRVAPFLDHVTTATLRRIDAPGAGDANKSAELDMIFRPLRLAGWEALSPG
jgi:uncharacterized protein YjbI with pentapeptide repeats